jgi:molybdopterin-guanine dinucleotide biosynthesis protein B
MKGLKNPPLVSIIGSSGVGKTTLLEKLIPELVRRGQKVGTIKHDVHGFEMDRPGKDSWRHKRAGASITVISSPNQVGMVMDVDHDHHPEELKKLFQSADIILTEGYKRQGKLKIEVFRPEVHNEPVCRNDKRLLALVSSVPLDLGVPRFSMDDVTGLADFLIRHFHLLPLCKRTGSKPSCDPQTLEGGLKKAGSGRLKRTG